ncbi:AAA family ATPase [Archangium lipolyticum]|uniref:AAA family ATPase n=1 Tax=Archangium lipolyticum TaxID=2970465 RepID=UPI00214A7513|nr:MoxR family ATPase [Archangium lipolyticum]
MTSSPTAVATATAPVNRSPALERLVHALEGTVLGQPQVVADLVTAFLARGHVLLEGVPGVAKTLTARSMASALGLAFTRVQFTPDLMPSDILGTNVFRPQDNAFQLVKGPVFTEVLVADEINRTPPKTQAALLEAMEERQVTIDGTTHALPSHFFVVATQNPLELEGTYPLPEAQLDRFLMRVRVGYPPPESELDMVRAFHQRQGKAAQVERVLDASALAELQVQAARVACDDSILSYVVRLIRETRSNPRVRLGASPRSSQALLAAAKARAALNGSDFVTPDDVKSVCPSVLNHRLLLKAEAEVEGLTADDVLRQTLERVQVPR